MTASDASNEGKLEALVSAVDAEHPRDVYVYAGPISRPYANQFLDQCVSQANDALLLLATYGGDADAAYKIAHCLQERYKKGRIQILVDVECKSAGTIVTLGAHEVIVSDRGELGPLDVQVRTQDELGELRSGLVPTQTMATLGEQAFATFEKYFLDIRGKSARQITTRTAAELATGLTVGLFEPIFAQIDPLRLGEIQRSMRVAHLYGERLRTDNLKSGALERLISGYPSHSYVIDRAEAQLLFRNVREPSVAEAALAEYIRPLMIDKMDDDAALIVRLDHPEVQEVPHDAEEPEGQKQEVGRTGLGASTTNGAEPTEEVRSVQ